jgi:hypothetical protein
MQVRARLYGTRNEKDKDGMPVARTKISFVLDYPMGIEYPAHDVKDKYECQSDDQFINFKIGLSLVVILTTFKHPLIMLAFFWPPNFRPDFPLRCRDRGQLAGRYSTLPARATRCGRSGRETAST